MNYTKYYLVCFIAIAMLLTGCSKDETVSPLSNSDETVALTFGALLNDMSRSQAISRDQHQNEIPGCSDADPAYVWVALQDADDNWVDGKNGDAQQFIEIGVMSDGSGGWMTEESPVLELSAGMYELHYFLVFDGDDNLLWVAPREDDTYEDGNFANFVSDPLPMDIDLRVGVKKYVDVEVLCYDENMADAYGYLFFDILEVDTITMCAFGNYCDDNGRHYPASFSVQAWMYSGDPNDPKGMELTNGAVMNETGIYDNGDAYALQACIALPDGAGDDEYYIEITLHDFEGVYDAEEGIIRQFVITDDQVNAISASNEYYHFREGTSCGDDTPDLENLPDPGNGGDDCEGIGDLDNDGTCDDVDPDIDGDDVPNNIDCDPLDPSVTSTNVNDADCDGVPTELDCDDDNPNVGNEAVLWYEDVDNDGFGDPNGSTLEQCEQPNGYVLNNTDNCPTVFNPDQTDTDGDGIGDACDPDIDGDTIPNELENEGCEFDPDPECGVVVEECFRDFDNDDVCYEDDLDTPCKTISTDGTVNYNLQGGSPVIPLTQEGDIVAEGLINITYSSIEDALSVEIFLEGGIAVNADINDYYIEVSQNGTTYTIGPDPVVLPGSHGDVLQFFVPGVDETQDILINAFVIYCTQ